MDGRLGERVAASVAVDGHLGARQQRAAVLVSTRRAAGRGRSWLDSPAGTDGRPTPSSAQPQTDSLSSASVSPSGITQGWAVL